MLNRSRWHRLVIGAMESAFALTAGITCARSQFPTPADGDWREGRGRLAVRGGWRFLHLEGSPREMGLQHGRLLRPVIQRVFEEYIGMIRLFRALSRAELLRRGRRLEPHIPAPYLEEMRGLADGAAMAYDDILIAHTFLESVQAVQCSCFAAHGAATRACPESDRRGGELIFGRNLDFVSMGIAQRCGLVIFCKPDGAIPFLSIAWPGWCGAITAVNLAGLCIGPLNVKRIAANLEGTPYVISFRQMAQEAATCDEAVALLRATRRTYSNNILLAQTAPARRAIVAEYTADEVVVREAAPGDDFIAATNHFRKLGRPVEFQAPRGSGRYATLMARLRERFGAIGLRTNILADPRIHLPNSLQTLVAAPERRTFRLAMGRMPAAEGPYRTLNYDENGIRLATPVTPGPVRATPS
ncbi:MAG: C45 family autoproteolytic acyltransferase/hydolase [Candidatus Brocadiia bacterium]